MRYRRAIEKLQALAEACESVKDWPPGDPFLLEAYVFGDVLQGADPLEYVEVVLVLNLPPQEVVWESSPHGTMWLADRLRLSKGGFAYWWRSHLDPVSNHHIHAPVRFWSQEGPDEGVLRALAERRFDDLPRRTPPPPAQREQLAAELEAALSHLRAQCRVVKHSVIKSSGMSRRGGVVTVGTSGRSVRSITIFRSPEVPLNTQSATTTISHAVTVAEGEFGPGSSGRVNPVPAVRAGR